MARDVVVASRDGGGGSGVGGVVGVVVRSACTVACVGGGKSAENKVSEKIRIYGLEHLRVQKPASRVFALG